ncbi:hypothetical protein NN561_003538 [Cricetulus griseus]
MEGGRGDTAKRGGLGARAARPAEARSPGGTFRWGARRGPRGRDRYLGLRTGVRESAGREDGVPFREGRQGTLQRPHQSGLGAQLLQSPSLPPGGSAAGSCKRLAPSVGPSRGASRVDIRPCGAARTELGGSAVDPAAPGAVTPAPGTPAPARARTPAQTARAVSGSGARVPTSGDTRTTPLVAPPPPISPTSDS